MKMKKVIIHSPGSYSKLKIETHESLELKSDNDIIIEVAAFGINFADICIRLGVYESAKQQIGWPITPGFEVSGVVKKIGSSVSNFQVGQKVIAFTLFNGYASEVCVPEHQVIPLPDYLSLEESAGFPTAFFTAYHAIFQNVKIRKNAKVLIHSAAGGVGTALVQLCKNEGFFAVGVIGSSHKKEYLKQFNLDAVIDKSQEDLWLKAKEICPQGFDVIFDANGAKTLGESYKHLRSTGKLIAYGAHELFSKGGSGRLNYIKAIQGLIQMPRFNPLKLITDNKSVIGFNASFLFDEKEIINEAIKELTKLLNDKKITILPTTRIEFGKIADAHRLIESGQSTGKIIITL